MRIAMIGKPNESVSELSARLVSAKQIVRVYPNRFFAVLHACLVFRADVIHFYGKVSFILKWIPRFLRPQASIVSTLRLREGVRVRRVAIDDVVLEPYKLRSSDFVLSVFSNTKNPSVDFLIAAWKRAKEMRPDVFRHLKLAIVGEPKCTSSFDDSIVFTGFQMGETMKALFAGAKFVVHPSPTEKLSTILEGMSYGKAVIAADCPALASTISEYGVPFSVGNIEDLADKILELAEDAMTTASLGHVARVFVEDEYSWDRIALETLDLYREAASGGIVASYETTRS